MRSHDSAIVTPPELTLERDVRGSQVHVRSRVTGQCLGCIEAGLFDLLRALVLAEAKAEASK